MRDAPFVAFVFATIVVGMVLAGALVWAILHGKWWAHPPRVAAPARARLTAAGLLAAASEAATKGDGIVYLRNGSRRYSLGAGSLLSNVPRARVRVLGFTLPAWLVARFPGQAKRDALAHAQRFVDLLPGYEVNAARMAEGRSHRARLVRQGVLGRAA